MKTIPLESAAAVIQQARSRGLLENSDTLTIFLDLSIVSDRINRLQRSFSELTFHAVAIKANPLRFVLKHILSQGVGLEAASMGEVLLARSAGAHPEAIVFDSPAKTQREIDELQRDYPELRVNIDSLDELKRYGDEASGLKLGLRINPLTVADSHATMTVSGLGAKFGEPISNRRQIREAFTSKLGLDCLHVHVGSQFGSLEPTVQAIRHVVDLAKEINAWAGEQHVSTIDIGGGFPVNYSAGEPLMVESYAERLRDCCPELFDGTYHVITEFGRYVHANSAFAWSPIEYVKTTPDSVTAITHAGADNFLRECYNPDTWHHEVGVIDQRTDQLKTNQSTVAATIAGPLCFGGDILARGIRLPEFESGDQIIIRDVGANTFSLYSRHCSRPFPKVIAYSSELDARDMCIAKSRETPDAIVAFWS